MARIINRFGTLIGWNDITVNLFGRDLEGITGVTYTDDQEMENAYGRGAYPQGQEIRNYTAEATLTLRLEEVLALQQSLPRGSRLQEIPGFDMVVSYEYQGSVYSDVVKNCRFKNNGREAAQGDGSMVVEFDLLCSHIEWNV